MTLRSPNRFLNIVGIVGDPIAHSRSPAMQNAAFRKAGLPFLYLPFHVRPAALGAFSKNARRWGLIGFNVTIPHKEAILRHLDRLSPEVKQIGAVNTVVSRRGKWIGHNTDGVGYLRSLRQETRFRPRGRTVTVLGAGGAARAVVGALRGAGAKKIFVVNRTLRRAQRLARDFRRLFPREPNRVEAIPCTRLREVFRQTDLLTNATSVGWHRTRFRSLPLSSLRRRAVVSDLVYEPKTALLTAARKRRLRTHSGLGMLLHQGAESFRLWTGRRPDLRVMRKALA